MGGGTRIRGDAGCSVDGTRPPAAPELGPPGRGCPRRLSVTSVHDGSSGRTWALGAGCAAGVNEARDLKFGLINENRQGLVRPVAPCWAVWLSAAGQWE